MLKCRNCDRCFIGAQAPLGCNTPDKVWRYRYCKAQVKTVPLTLLLFRAQRLYANLHWLFIQFYCGWGQRSIEVSFSDL